MKKFFQEFKTFISRGNVIDLAVGVIIGGAFTAIVTAVTGGIFTPIINWLLKLILGSDSLSEIYTYLTKVMDETGAIDLANSIYIDWGAVINAIINFVLTAFILFSIIKAVNRAKDMAPKYAGYTKEEYFKMRKQGLSKEQIEEMGKKRDEEAAAAKKAADEEAKKHTTEALLEDIKKLLESKQK